MAYINVETLVNEHNEVDVDDILDELEDDVLIDALEYRGFSVFDYDPAMDYDTTNIQWHVERGDLKEALLEIERTFPELKGIVNLHK